MKKQDYLEILRQEVIPSLGVTEPGAVALCCAAASDNNRIQTRKIELNVSPSIYKNCLSVGIPGFSQKGIAAAAALGAVGGDFHKGLEALSSAGGQSSAACRKLIDSGAVTVHITHHDKSLYIEAICIGQSGRGRCIIENSHTNITLLEHDGQIIRSGRSGGQDAQLACVRLMEVTLDEMLENVLEMQPQELTLMRQGGDMNLQAARWGLKNRPGMGAGGMLNDLLQQGILEDSLSTDLQIYTAAAADVRVSGSFIPIMTCSGSGNHGIAAIVSVMRAAERLQASETRTLQALALSCLITIYIKNFSGRLSGMCGCGVAAATGAAAAICMLMGGGHHEIAGAIKNMAGDITGMICDGAKEGCALKLSTAAASAVRAALFAKNGLILPDDNGIISPSVEETMQNMGRVSSEGMSPTDHVILDIMSKKAPPKEKETLWGPIF